MRLDMNKVIEVLGVVAVTALVNGAVTYGVIQTKLDYLDRGVQEAKNEAGRANSRVDSIMSAGFKP